MSHNYEIEIKSLLGSQDKADALKTSLDNKFPKLKTLSKHRQLNHYFNVGDFKKLHKAILPYIPKESVEKFSRVLKDGKSFSVRTRDTEGKVQLVIKASIDNTTSDNGISRIEFEAVTPDLTLAKLDKILLDCGFSYQAKWSREREEYEAGDMHVCLDKNAGYGYVAEFEKVITDPSLSEKAALELRSLMTELGVSELPQDRLERMFAHYNKHWSEYYGTDNIFTVL